MVFSGTVQQDYKEIVKNMNLEMEIGERKKLSLEEYEEIHENKEQIEISRAYEKMPNPLC